MKLFTASTGPAVFRRAGLALVAAALVLQGGLARAQCTLSGTVSQFEPNPPGVPRPSYMNWGGINEFQLNQPPGGPPRLFVSDPFGYTQVDLTDPQNPSALGYEDYRFSPSNPGPVPCNGDCHSSILAHAASPDGQRYGFVLASWQSSPFHSVVGSASGTGWQVTVAGDMQPLAGRGIAIQQVAGRYLSYTLDDSAVRVADVTNLPGTLAANNLPTETVGGAPGGASPVLAGPYLAYMGITPLGITNGTINLVNVGSPGPAGSIASGLSFTSVAPSAWSRPAGDQAYAFHAAVDPSNSSAIFILAEFMNGAQHAGYSLMRYVGGTGTLVGRVNIPVAAGESWTAGSTVGLYQQGGSLFAFMWALRSAPTQIYRLLSTPVTAFGSQAPGQIDVDKASYAGFITGHLMAAYEHAGKLYLYVPSGTSGWVVPTTCISTNSPAVSLLSASSYGAPLSSGATVFVGDRIDITAGVAPAPSQQPLTPFGWNFDFDFHATNATEDAGATPRIKNSDNAVLASPTVPPTAITLVGPCDPKAGGDPSTGTGCWNSVKTNSAAGGPDFLGTEAAGVTKALSFALEANNQYGSTGTNVFNLNWKVPAARLQTTQILSGGTLTSASDGHPTGYKWYFGASPTTLVLRADCTGATCTPLTTDASKGTHPYWLTTTYAGGYATPDYAGTAAMGTYSVTDFAPAFTVNGSAAGPVTAITSSSLSVVNSSQHGAAITGAYLYNICQIPNGQSTCAAGAYTAFAGMTDPPSSGAPPTSASIQAPSVTAPTSFLLRIQVNYTGGTTYWPDPTQAAGFPLTVTNVIPEIRFNCVTGFQCTDINSFSANTGDSISAYAYVSGGKDFNPPPGLSWTMSGASPGSCSGPAGCQPATFSYGTPGTYTVTMTGYGTPVNATVRVTQPPVSLSVSAFANPQSPTVGQQVSFSCSPSGGTSNYTAYSWNFGDGNVSPTSFAVHAYQTGGNFSASCTVTDSGGHVGSGSVLVSVGSGGGGGGACTGVLNLFRSLDGQFPDPAGFPGAGFSIGWGTAITFVANAGYGSYSWDFGDGQTGTGQTVTHTYGQGSIGNRTISLTVDGCTKSYPIAITGSAGPTLSCSGTTYVIQGATYQAANGFGDPAGWRGVGVGATATFTATSPSTATASAFDWNWGDGTPHGTTASATHAYLGAGTYPVTLTITATDNTNGASGTCSTTLNVIVEGPSGQFLARYEDASPFVPTNVLGYKNLVFTASDPPANADSYTWDFGDGSAHAAGRTATHSFIPGSWTVRLTVLKGAGSATSTQPLTVVAPPEPPKWVVPGMAYVLGQVPNTTWQSDVTVFNPDPTRSATYAFAFLDARNPVDDGSKLTWLGPIQVPPLGSVSSANVLKDTFGQTLGAYGALMVRGDVAPAVPLVTARTYNAGDAATGTFGLSVPTVSASSGGVTSQASLAASVLIGLRQNAAAYTNIGLVNLKNEWPTVVLDFVDGSTASTLAPSMTVTMRPYQALQINRALLAAGYSGTSDLYTVRVSLRDGTAVYPYATVIDTGTSDPIVVTPSDSPSNAYRVPGVVRLTGAKGELWRSRVTVTNPTGSSRKVHMSFSYVACNVNGCSSRVSVDGDVRFSPGQTQSWDDFVKVWLSVKGLISVDDTTTYQASFLDVKPADGDPIQDPLVVLGETYNATPNGHVGLQIPGYSPVDGASRAGANKRLVLTGLSSTASSRTNFALFVVAGATGRWVNVHVFSPQGTNLRDVPVLVDGFAQLGDGTLFGGLPGDLSRLSLVVDNIDDGVTVGGYATIIDNTSGDATFVKAAPAP